MLSEEIKCLVKGQSLLKSSKKTWLHVLRKTKPFLGQSTQLITLAIYHQKHIKISCFNTLQGKKENKYKHKTFLSSRPKAAAAQ
jgi:hypothetical protein